MTNPDMTKNITQWRDDMNFYVPVAWKFFSVIRGSFFSTQKKFLVQFFNFFGACNHEIVPKKNKTQFAF